jgi:hypothetical protein
MNLSLYSLPDACCESSLCICLQRLREEKGSVMSAVTNRSADRLYNLTFPDFSPLHVVLLSYHVTFRTLCGFENVFFALNTGILSLGS